MHCSINSRLPTLAARPGVSHNLVLVVMQPHQLINRNACNGLVLDGDMDCVGGGVDSKVPSGISQRPWVGPHGWLAA